MADLEIKEFNTKTIMFKSEEHSYCAFHICENGMVSVQSDWGEYTYIWRISDLFAFLSVQNSEYIVNKLLPINASKRVKEEITYFVDQLLKYLKQKQDEKEGA